MRLTWARWALVAVLATTASAIGSRAIAQQASDMRVFVELKDADMVTATRMLTQRTGVQFLIEPTSEPYGRITLKLDGVTADDAVGYICLAAGAYFRRDDNGVFIISRTKPVAPVTEVKPVAKPRLVRKIKVLKAGARDVFDSILFGIPFNSMRGFEELKRFQNIVKPEFDRVFGQNNNLEASMNGAYQSYKPVQNFATPQPLTGVETGNEIRLPGEEAGQIGGRGGGMSGGMGGGQFGGGGGQFGGGGGQFGGGGGQFGGGGGQFGGGQGGNVNLTGGQGLVGESINYISYDPTDNTIVVRGTEEDIAQLQTYINMFDVAPRQVQIKVEFITTGSNFENNIGYNLTYNRGAFVTGFEPSLPSGAGSVFLSWSSGNFATRLRAVLKENNSTSFSAPVIRTLNNQFASVTSFVTTTFFISQTIVNNNQTITTSNPVIFQAGTTLAVAPRINDDDTITMALTPSIQDPTDSSIGPDGTVIPNFRGQQLAVIARVRNGETVVLAGFNTKSNSNNVVRVPVLSELPIIGQFFRTTLKRKNNSELLIFVTPTIIDEDDTAAPGGP